GSLYVAGSRSRSLYDPGNLTTTYYVDVFLARFGAADGALDKTFGAGTGFVFVTVDSSGGFGIPYAFGRAIALLSGGDIVVAGSWTTDFSMPYQGYLARFTSAGAPASGFGTGGLKKFTVPSTVGAIFSDLFVDGFDRLIVG